MSEEGGGRRTAGEMDLSKAMQYGRTWTVLAAFQADTTTLEGNSVNECKATPPPRHTAIQEGGGLLVIST